MKSFGQPSKRSESSMQFRERNYPKSETMKKIVNVLNFDVNIFEENIISLNSLTNDNFVG